MSSIAIIPARGGSKRIPKKNIKHLLGKPIIAYSIQSAISSKLFDEVMVSTDDKEIAEIVKNLGVKVPFYRSEKNSDDFATTADVIEEVLIEYKTRGLEFENFCCIYPTAAFITSDKLIESYNMFINSNVNSLIPLVKYSHPIQRAIRIKDGKIEYIWPENVNRRTQDLEPTYHDAGQFYWGKAKCFLEEKRLVSENTGFIELSNLEVQDIDNMDDWKLAEIKMKELGSEKT